MTTREFRWTFKRRIHILGDRRIHMSLVPLFWISGSVSFGFESQSGFCLICTTEGNVMHIPPDPPLVLHMPTSWHLASQPVTSPHVSAEMGLGSDSNGQSPDKRRTRYHCASDLAEDARQNSDLLGLWVDEHRPDMSAAAGVQSAEHYSTLSSIQTPNITLIRVCREWVSITQLFVYLPIKCLNHRDYVMVLFAFSTFWYLKGLICSLRRIVEPKNNM